MAGSYERIDRGVQMIVGKPLAVTLYGCWLAGRWCYAKARDGINALRRRWGAKKVRSRRAGVSVPVKQAA